MTSSKSLMALKNKFTKASTTAQAAPVPKAEEMKTAFIAAENRVRDSSFRESGMRRKGYKGKRLQLIIRAHEELIEDANLLGFVDGAGRNEVLTALLAEALDVALKKHEQNSGPEQWAQLKKAYNLSRKRG